MCPQRRCGTCSNESTRKSSWQPILAWTTHLVHFWHHLIQSTTWRGVRARHETPSNKYSIQKNCFSRCHVSFKIRVFENRTKIDVIVVGNCVAFSGQTNPKWAGHKMGNNILLCEARRLLVKAWQKSLSKWVFNGCIKCTFIHPRARSSVQLSL